MSIDEDCQSTLYKINCMSIDMLQIWRYLCQATEIRKTMSVDMIQMKLHVKRHVTEEINERSMSSDIVQMKLRAQNCQLTKLHETTKDKDKNNKSKRK